MCINVLTNFYNTTTKNWCQNQFIFIMFQIRTRNHSHKTSLIFQLQDGQKCFVCPFQFPEVIYRINDLRIELNNVRCKLPNNRQAININQNSPNKVTKKGKIQNEQCDKLQLKQCKWSLLNFVVKYKTPNDK